MKKMFWSILILLFLNTSVRAESWSKPDKILLGIYLIGETIDVLQTHKILHNDRFYEMNPLIKDDKSLAICAIVTTVIIILVAHFCPKIRRPVLAGSNLIKWSMVGNNFSIGVRF